MLRQWSCSQKSSAAALTSDRDPGPGAMGRGDRDRPPAWRPGGIMARRLRGRVGALVVAGDEAGVSRFREIAWRLEQLMNPQSVQ